MENEKKIINDDMSVKIVDAAEQIIIEHGIEYLNVSKILKLLSITNRVFYNRFNNIQEVLNEVYNRVVTQKRELISVEYQDGEDFFEYVTNIAINFVTLAYDVQDKFNYFIFGSDVFTQQNYEWYLNRIKELIALGRSKNLLKDFDDDAMSYYIWCSCRGFNTDIVMRMPKETAVEIFKESFKFLLKGIKK